MRPRPVVADDGIEGSEQLAHDGDESEACGFACVAQPPIAASQWRIVLDGDQAAHVYRETAR
jgi:hypothetical protein